MQSLVPRMAEAGEWGKFNLPEQTGLAKDQGQGTSTKHKSPSSGKSQRGMKAEGVSFSDLLSQGSPKKKSKREVETTIRMEISKYTEDGSIFQSFLGQRPLLAVSIEHDSVTFRMKDNWEQFTQRSMSDFQIQWSALYISNNEIDEDNVGQQPYLKGFMVAGGIAEMKNFLCYFDSFVLFRRQDDPKARIPATVVYEIKNFTGNALAFQDGDLSYPATIEQCTGPGCLLKLQPNVLSKRMLIAVMDFPAMNQVKVVFDGETYVYRSLFEEGNVPGAWLNEDGVEVDRDAGDVEYVRSFPVAMLDNADHVTHILAFLGTGLRKTAFAYRVSGDHCTSKLAQAFLRRVRDETNGVAL